MKLSSASSLQLGTGTILETEKANINHLNLFDMRQYFSTAKSKYLAKKECVFTPVIVATVCGGFICFESANDYKTWINQK